MADNVAITAGAGTTIATEDISGVHHQKVKIEFGADGAATLVEAAAPLPVTLTNLERAEDAAHSSAHVGIMPLGVVTTDGDGTSATDGDYAAFTLASTGALRVTGSPTTYDGFSVYRDTDIDETESTVKASAGKVYGLSLWNVSTTAAHFVHLYDAANPDTSADTPLASFMIPKGAAGAPGVLNIDFQHGIPFATAITIGALTTMAPGAGGPGASEVQGTVWYK